MKITNAEKKNSKYNELNIIISNAKYLVNPVPIHQLKAGDNMLEYKAIGKFSDEEASLLKESLKDAYLYINETCKLLEKPNPQSLEILEAILGDLNESNSDENNANESNVNESDVNESDSESPLNLNSLLSIIKEIRSKILNPKLVVLKENYLDTEKDHILASVEEDDSFTFTVYENFFDKGEFKDNRSGVIIHELCHLCGIEEGVDMYDLDSAECLKNIILCLNNKITLDEIQAEYARKQEVQERNDDTLTYDENQARVEKGNPNGGQWTSDGSSGGSRNSSASSESSAGSENKNSTNLNSSDKGDSKLSIANNLIELAQTNDTVRKEDIYKTLDFDPEGWSEMIVGGIHAIKEDGFWTASTEFFSTLLGSSLALEAKKLKDDKYGNNTNSKEYNDGINSLKRASTLSGAAKAGVPAIIKVEALSQDAKKLAKKLFPELENASNNEADAFRHAYFNYRLTEEIGVSEAKKLADAHEISYKNKDGERAMDLFNNEIGRQLYQSNKTKGKDEAIKIIQAALKNGLLRTKPYTINK